MLVAFFPDVNMLYVACTRTKNQLSLPASSLIRVAEAFDNLHKWKQLRDTHPQTVNKFTQVSIDGVDELVDEDDAFGFTRALFYR